MKRRNPLCAFLLAVLCGAGVVALPARVAHGAVSVQQGEAGIVVRSPHHEVTISPAAGGRIVSFVFDGVELTRLSRNGHGGLMEEVHTADCPFEVLEASPTASGATVRLQADAGPLRVVKDYRFSNDSPLLTVELAFENRSAHRLGGAQAPAVRNLVTPAGRPGGRELFCMDRGAGAEVMSAGLLLARSGASGPLRWIAVSDPAARRTLGFALLSGGCRLIPPLRTPEGLLATGWSCPPVPPGRRVTVRVLLAPLQAFATVAEMNEQFACDSVPDLRADPPAAQFGLLPFRTDMREVSVTTRTYDEKGRELGLCDPLLFHEAQALRAVHGRVAWRGSDSPAWLLHEVYSRGVKLGEFAVPVRRGGGEPPPTSAPPTPEPEPVEGLKAPCPGEAIPVGPDAARRGFVLWQFDGAPAGAELSELELHVARGQRRTVFLGVRALRDAGRLRFTLAAGAQGNAGPRPIPPAAVTLWQVLDDPDGEAQMVPLRELDLAAGEVAWLALTADAAGLSAGRYAARLTAGADADVRRVPLALEVAAAGPPDADAFPVWYAPPCTGGPLPDPAQAKLSACGVSALTVPLPRREVGRAATEAAAQAERRGWAFLAFCSDGGAHPPAGEFATRLALAHPRPVWLMDAGRAVPGAAEAAAEAGCTPALLCERLGALQPEMLSGVGRPPFLLVEGGCEPGRAQQMFASGLLNGEESVWLYLDLRGADWRHAATQVRSAFWAAAYQGLAGAAVAGPVPFREVDRHSPIWHIVRDARREVALWRTSRQQARAAGAARDEEGRAEALRRIALIESIVGTADGYDLVLRPEKRPFRTVLRVAGGGDDGPSLSAFRAVHRKLLALAAGLPEAAPLAGEPGQLYWDDVPLLHDGRVRWVIVASDGEAVWKRAMALQGVIRDAGGRAVPVSRTFPDLRGTEPPTLVWVVGRPQIPEDWPAPARAQAERHGSASLTAVRLDCGTTVAILGEAADLGALARGLRRTLRPYPVARHVR